MLFFTKTPKITQAFDLLSLTINIDEMREHYTKLYNYVRDVIIGDMKKTEFFSELYCDYKLAGSYSDKLKIYKPDEFDLLMAFEFPANHLVTILSDNKRYGNVLLDLTEVLRYLEEDGRSWNMHTFLRHQVNEQNLFLENKFQQWIQKCMQRALNNINSRLIYEDIAYLLLYRKSGPAHTITVKEITANQPLFSIDFVPAIRLGSDKSISLRDLHSEFWMAVPKPLKEINVKDNPSFRASYHDSERIIIAKKHQLKNGIKLMKKFRDRHYRLTHLKSYFIKTLFLWHDLECDPGFWRKPISEIMLTMFRKLEEALQNGEIRFFWDKNLNMMSELKSTQIKDMYATVVKARICLDQCTRKQDVVDLFLTSEEQVELFKKVKDQRLIADSLEEIKGNRVVLSLFCIIGALVAVWLQFSLYTNDWDTDIEELRTNNQQP